MYSRVQCYCTNITNSLAASIIRKIEWIRRSYPSRTDGRCPLEFAIASKIEFSRSAWSPYHWGNVSSGSTAIYARGRGSAHNNREENRERWYFVVWATSFTLGLLLLLGWALKMEKLYTMKKYVEPSRRNDEETAAALQLGDIDAAQEESVLEKESAKKPAPPKNKLQKVANEKIVSRLLLCNVRFIWW